MVNTNWSNITTFEGMLTQANAYSPFWTTMLWMIFVVLLITFTSHGFIVALLGASFLAFITGLLLSYMGLVAWSWTLTILGILIFTILYLIVFGNQDN